MSGMISDLPSDWRTKLDERIVSQANTLSQQNYSIFRGYINAWKCDEVSLPHHDGNHTTCIIYCNRDYNVKYGGETLFYDNNEDVIGAVSLVQVEQFFSMDGCCTKQVRSTSYIRMIIVIRLRIS